jgi:hypothetical protein
VCQSRPCTVGNWFDSSVCQCVCAKC